MAQDEKYSENNMQSNYEPPPPQSDEKILLHWRKVVPNSLTVLAIVVGMSAFVMALEGDFRNAVFFTFIAGLLDGLDGPVARYLKGASRFGAELDSLADYINFGATPAFVVYLWKRETWQYQGWFTCVFYAVAMACRLARFNAGVDFNASKETKIFFMGVPAPAGAMLALFPLCLEHKLGTQTSVWRMGSFYSDIRFLIPYYCVVSWLIISEIPTFSSKAVTQEFFQKSINLIACLVLAIVFSALAFLDFWLFMVAGNVVYLFLIPIASLTFHQLINKEQSTKKTKAKIVHNGATKHKL